MTETLLPVELTTFTASMSNGKILLEWETASEVNNYGFSIERKTIKPAHDTAWQAAGFVHGNDYSNAHHYYTFTETPSGNSNTIAYRLKQIDNDGNFKYSHTVTVNAVSGTFAIQQNFPNPFNPVTTINFEIPADSRVTLRIYNILGKKIATLLDDYKQTGRYSIPFDASNFASGVYFYRLTAGTYTAQKKMILLR